MAQPITYQFEDDTAPGGVTYQFEDEQPQAQVSPIARTVSEYARPALEYGGMMLGGVLGGGGAGAVSAGTGAIPGAIAGAGLGYAGGRQAANVLDQFLVGKQPQDFLTEAGQAGKDFVSGSMMEMGGGVINKALQGGANLISKAAPKLYESVVKPVPSLGHALRERAMKTGIEGGYTANAKGLTMLQRDINITNSEIAKSIDKATKTNNRIDMDEVVSRVEGLKDFYRSLPPERAKPFLDEIGDIASQYASAGQVTAQEAQTMKQTIYRLHRKHYGEMKSAIVEAEKQIARGLKEELVRMHPELSRLNAKDSALYELENVLERTVNRTGNWNLVGLSDIAGATAGGVVGMTGAEGGVGGGATGALAGMVFTRALRSPDVISRLAFALAKARGVKAPVVSRGVSYGATREEE